MIFKKNNETAVFTIVARNYLAYASTLCKSIKENNPNVDVFIAISDIQDDEFDWAQVIEFKRITLDELNLPREKAFCFRYDVMEFATAIKPYVFAFLSELSYKNIVYLDPDIYVTSSLDCVTDELENGSSIVITPHITDRIDDGFFPNERTMLQVGVYNLGFIGVANDAEGRRFIRWWKDRLEYFAYNDLAEGLFTDQKWIDLVPSLFNRVGILKNPGLNAAYWNIMHRRIRRDKSNSKWLANDSDLVFFHFSGVAVKNVDAFSKHQNRYEINDIGELSALYTKYIEELKSNGAEVYSKLAYGFNHTYDHMPIDGAVRAYFRHYLDTAEIFTYADPFALGYDYWNSTTTEIDAFNNSLSRYMVGFWLWKKRYLAKFDLTSPEGQDEYINWFHQNAAREYSVDSAFIKKDASKKSNYVVKKINYKIRRLVLTIFVYPVAYFLPKVTSNCWNRLPANIRHSIKSKFFTDKKSAAFMRYVAHEGNKNSPSVFSKIIDRFKRPKIKKAVSATGVSNVSTINSVALIGYSKGDFGVAENLRSVAKALVAKEIQFEVLSLDTGNAYSETNRDLDQLCVKTTRKKIQIFCINADQTAHQIRILGLDHQKSYKIAIWFWELEKFPEDWRESEELIDEFWAPSRFIYDSLKKFTKKPVVYVPVVVEFESKVEANRKRFNIPSDSFCFMFNYDYRSWLSRKNPDAVIESFQRAFPEPSKNVCLLIKTQNSDAYAVEHLKLLRRVLNDNRIIIVDESLSRSEMYCLLKSIDCFVSLHRSEGFGLGMAEAMYLCKPIIATGYSGNMDFTNSENSCIVDYRLVPLRQDEYPFWLGQMWAEPDLESAAASMRRVFDDKEYRIKIQTEARKTISSQHSSHHVGNIIKKRLDEINNETH